jgi:ferrochelatase
MLIGFGAPTAMAEVRPFLDRVLAGRPIPTERYEEIVGHYEAFGGRSPYNEITMRQAAALQRKLREIGLSAPVSVGFRNTPPFFDDALRELKDRGIDRALGFVFAAHRSEASWDRYLNEIEHARQRFGSDAPQIEYPTPWHDDSAFIEAVAERTRQALEGINDSRQERAGLIFTAHSIPLSMSGRAEYVGQLEQSARLVAKNLGVSEWVLAFQSRSGNPREPWLVPDVREVLRGFRGRPAVVVPLGFLCDHVEVLYDLDIEAARIASEAGVAMVRAPTVGEHPKFIEMMARIAERHLSPNLSRAV